MCAGGLWIKTAIIALQHTGVQYRWLAAPHFCRVISPEGEGLEEMTQNLLETPVTDCAQISASFLGQPF